jgi:hypothetical protein
LTFSRNQNQQRETVASLRIRLGGRKDDEMSLLPVSSAHASRSSSPANNIGGSMSRGGSSHGGTAAIRSRGKTALGKLKVLLRRSANFKQMVRVQDLVSVDSRDAPGLGEARRAGSKACDPLRRYLKYVLTYFYLLPSISSQPFHDPL